MQCFLWNWNPPELNPYEALMVETMHQADLGILAYVRKGINETNTPQTLRRLNARLKAVAQAERWQSYYLPKRGYFGPVKYITAAQHRAVFEVIVAVAFTLLQPNRVVATRSCLVRVRAEGDVHRGGFESLVGEGGEVSIQTDFSPSLSCIRVPSMCRVVRCLDTAFVQTSNWQLVKIHMLTHYLPSIRRAGPLNQYSAQMWEHSHIWTVKQPCRRSNRRGAIPQLFAFHQRRDAEQQHPMYRFIHRKRRRNETMKQKVCLKLSPCHQIKAHA